MTRDPLTELQLALAALRECPPAPSGATLVQLRSRLFDALAVYRAAAHGVAASDATRAAIDGHLGDATAAVTRMAGLALADRRRGDDNPSEE